MNELPYIQKTIQHNIRYRVYGNGKPLMLLHGFAEDSTIWTDQLETLSANFTLILPDLPGSGISADTELKTLASIDDFARLILHIVDAEKLDSFTLMGHSMGGYITLSFAEQFPERLNAFGLIHSSAFADSDEKKINRKRSIQFIEQYGVPAFVETTIPGLYGSVYATTHPEAIQKHIQEASVFEKNVLGTYYEMMMNRPNRKKVLEAFEKPILFIIGTQDKAVLLNDSLDQCYLPSKHVVHIWEDVGHMGMKEVPDKLTKAITEFMAAL